MVAVAWAEATRTAHRLRCDSAGASACSTYFSRSSSWVTSLWCHPATVPVTLRPRYRLTNPAASRRSTWGGPTWSKSTRWAQWSHTSKESRTQRISINKVRQCPAACFDAVPANASDTKPPAILFPAQCDTTTTPMQSFPLRRQGPYSSPRASCGQIFRPSLCATTPCTSAAVSRQCPRLLQQVADGCWKRVAWRTRAWTSRTWPRTRMTRR